MVRRLGVWHSRPMNVEPSAALRRDVLPVRSMAIAAFSTIVEWYDFTLYLYFATVLSRVFYGGGTQSLLITLGGFAIAYLMRPLGAILRSPPTSKSALGEAVPIPTLPAE